MTSAKQLFALGADLGGIWSAPSTSDRDRKALGRAPIEEMIAVALPQPQPAIPTDENTIALLIRLATHYDDGATAGILNRRGRRSAARPRTFRSSPPRGMRPMEARVKHWAGARPLVLRPRP
jgi:hypothetical protein